MDTLQREIIITGWALGLLHYQLEDIDDRTEPYISGVKSMGGEDYTITVSYIESDKHWFENRDDNMNELLSEPNLKLLVFPVRFDSLKDFAIPFSEFLVENVTYEEE